MNESPISLLSPEVGYKHERLLPSQLMRLSKDDYLAVSVYTTSATTNLVLAYRYQDSAGELHYGSESLDGASTSTLTTKIFHLSEGFLLGVSITNLGGGLADQVCYVIAGLQRSGQASTPPHTVLAQGYVSNLFTVDWPPVYVRGPAPGGSSLAKAYTDSLVDYPPASPNAMDDEFDAATLNTSLWAWENQGTATATFTASRLVLAEPAPAGSTDDLRILRQAVPTGAWEFTCQCDLESLPVNYNLAGLLVRDKTGTLYIGIFPGYRTIGAGGAQNLTVAYWNSVSHLSSYLFGGATGQFPIPRYLRIAYDATNLIFSISTAGCRFTEVFREVATTHLTAGPGFVGPFICPLEQTTTPMAGTYDWFRRTA